MTASPRRLLKRSRTLVLTTMAAGATVSLAACDSQNPATQWGDNPPAASRSVDAQSYASLDECKAAGVLSGPACDAAYAQAQKDAAANAPKFSDQQSCEERYGVDQCVPRGQQGGGSFFTPLLTGFIVGQALNNMGGGYRGAPMYRDRDGGYVTGYGGRIDRDYLTGRSRVRADAFEPPSARAPSRVQSRSAVISRGGFGGGSRGYGG
jgi:uncharacterized protein YgiB involved in biofilm formation